jgi:hypothetical protein
LLHATFQRDVGLGDRACLLLLLLKSRTRRGQEGATWCLARVRPSPFAALAHDRVRVPLDQRVVRREQADVVQLPRSRVAVVKLDEYLRVVDGGGSCDRARVQLAKLGAPLGRDPGALRQRLSGWLDLE